MHNRDAVIRHAADCAVNHGSEVRDALNRYIASETYEREHRTRVLRYALVAQAAGHEACAHNGSTYQRRVEAAKAALTAWDSPVEAE